MTPREQLIREVLDAPDFLVSMLLKLLRLIRLDQGGMAQRLARFVANVESSADLSESGMELGVEPVLLHEGSALVVGGQFPEGFDIEQFVADLREERIREQMGL